MKKKLLSLLLALAILLSVVSVSSVQTEAAGKWKKTAKGTRYVSKDKSLLISRMLYIFDLCDNPELMTDKIAGGKRKCDMDVWHFEDDCAKCKKAKK